MAPFSAFVRVVAATDFALAPRATRDSEARLHVDCESIAFDLHSADDCTRQLKQVLEESSRAHDDQEPNSQMASAMWEQLLMSPRRPSVLPMGSPILARTICRALQQLSLHDPNWLQLRSKFGHSPKPASSSYCPKSR